MGPGNAIVCLVDTRNALQERVRAACVRASLPIVEAKSILEASEKIKPEQNPVLILNSAFRTQAALCEAIQSFKFLFADSNVAAVVDSNALESELRMIRKSGATYLLDSSAYLHDSIIELLIARHSTGSVLPIKPAEVHEGLAIPFSIYHAMPLNRRFIRMVRSGSMIDQDIKRSLGRHKELYAMSSEYPQVVEYQTKARENANLDRHAVFRRMFKVVEERYIELVLEILTLSIRDDLNSGREYGRQLFEVVKEISVVAKSIDDPWIIVDFAGFNHSFVLQRRPAIALMAGMLAHATGSGIVEVAIIGALLCEIGLAKLPVTAVNRILADRFYELNSEEKQLYHQHPTASLGYCLERKIPLEPKLQDVIRCSNERVDGKGFPNRPVVDKIPPEAQLIQFCEALDQRAVVEMGKNHPVGFTEVLAQFLEEESKLFRYVTPTLFASIRNFKKA